MKNRSVICLSIGLVILILFGVASVKSFLRERHQAPAQPQELPDESDSQKAAIELTPEEQAWLAKGAHGPGPGWKMAAVHDRQQQ